MSIAILILIVGGFVWLGSGSSSPTGNTIAAGNGEVQKIVLSTKDYNYYPNTIKVKANQPVSISLDSSVSGCLRSFTIRDLGLVKYLKTPQDTLDFTPSKPGTYKFSCSMGMGTGTLIVE
ncbi:MAG TPA: cupredoxin domain-containing protein [Candidatus Nanoarchaeia archaeon]|nr:cupredoxin domain-containing protein [Candidatus Nanoarchaeia archaeon]